MQSARAGTFGPWHTAVDRCPGCRASGGGTDHLKTGARFPRDAIALICSWPVTTMEFPPPARAHPVHLKLC